MWRPIARAFALLLCISPALAFEDEMPSEVKAALELQGRQLLQQASSSHGRDRGMNFNPLDSMWSLTGASAGTCGW